MSNPFTNFCLFINVRDYEFFYAQLIQVMKVTDELVSMYRIVQVKTDYVILTLIASIVKVLLRACAGESTF